MSFNLVARATGKTIPLTALNEDGLAAWLAKAGKKTAAWVEAANSPQAAVRRCCCRVTACAGRRALGCGRRQRCVVVERGR